MDKNAPPPAGEKSKIKTSAGADEGADGACADVLNLCDRMNRKHVFVPGDLVRWKPGLRNKFLPEYGSYAVVVEVLDTPFRDIDTSAGSPYFNEPLDLVLAMIARDGDFLTCHYDRRRFEPVKDVARIPEAIKPS